jgi:hypothetical protein
VVTLVAALDPTRSPGELALMLAMLAVLVVAAGYLGWLVCDPRQGK